MKIILYSFLGFIQGITEPIPVSSSGHLVIINSILKIEEFNDLNFEIFSNFGSFIAITYFYRKEIIKIICDFFLYIRTKEIKYKINYKYAWYIIIGSIPAGIIGLLLKEKIESINNIKIVGLSLLITAFMLFLVKNINGYKDKDMMNYKDALIIGLFQSIALFPGISRSGSTLVGGLYRNLNKKTAFTFSFMLYIPISIATMILGIRDINYNLLKYYFIGMIISTIVTYYSLKIFKKIIEKGNIKYFIYYCIILGIITIIFL